MRGDVITLDRAVELARTGDIWVFRGTSRADRAIRGLTNAPVNHVGMAVALDDLPPLMWHAELGRSLPDMWTGKLQRGVQLHDLRSAVLQWGQRYGQRGWVRQLSGELTHEHEDGLLRAIARLDRCDRGWCRLSVDKVSGWVRAGEVWGTAPERQCR